MLSVSEFLNSFNKNQLVIKIAIQTDEFTDIEYPTGSHLHFDDDYVVLTNCKVSPKNFLFIFEGVTKTKQEIKLFWGEHHFDILKYTLPCSETVTEFETLKQQTTQTKCVDLNQLKQFLSQFARKKLYTSLMTEQRNNMIPLIVIILYK